MRVRLQFLLFGIFFMSLLMVWMQIFKSGLHDSRILLIARDFSVPKYSFDESSLSELTPFSRPRFRFILEPSVLKRKKCHGAGCNLQQKTHWTMVNFIKSKANNFKNRADIRRTWASTSWYNGAALKTVFVVANPKPEFASRLLLESETFGDILQFDGPDDYRYVPLKTLAGMQWASENLPTENYFYSSGDDDFMLNVGRLVTVLEITRKNLLQFNWPEFPIVCTYKILPSHKPTRVKDGPLQKWYISNHEYKWPYYPKSCHGGFYTISMSVVKQLFQVSRTERYLRVDDVWITGILRVKIGMPNDMVLKPLIPVAFHKFGGLASDPISSENKIQWVT